MFADGTAGLTMDEILPPKEDLDQATTRATRPLEGSTAPLPVEPFGKLLWPSTLQ